MIINSYSSHTNNYNKFKNNQNTSFSGYNLDAIQKQAKSFAKAPMDRSTSYLAKGIGYIASLKATQKLVDFLKDKEYQAHLAAFVGVVLSGFYMLDTAKSKTIEKDQKLPLILNQGAVCALSTAGAYTLNNYLNKKLDKVTDLFHISKIENPKLQDKFLKFRANSDYADVVRRAAEKNPKLKAELNAIEKMFNFNSGVKTFIKEELKNNKNDNVAREFLKELKTLKITDGRDKTEVVKELFLSKMKNSKVMQKAFNQECMKNAINRIANNKEIAGKLPKMINGFKTAKSLMIFALIYRFVSPVVATPFANWVSEKLEKKAK